MVLFINFLQIAINIDLLSCLWCWHHSRVILCWNTFSYLFLWFYFFTFIPV